RQTRGLQRTQVSSLLTEEDSHFPSNPKTQQK
ncbi:unnamed protein product, partial [Tetraodon nigroviridis]